MNWTEKYRPKSIVDIVGNSRAKKLLIEWAKKWQEGRPEKKAVILYGKPGVGKTSSAYAIAHDFGWDVIEMNASDERNRERIRKIAFSGAVNESLFYEEHGRKKLIIIDEADNLYERQGDAGGKKAIVETIRNTKQPIVLIANDYYGLIKSSPLKDICLSIEFKPVPSREIARLLKKICRMEGIEVSDKVLIEIAERSSGDVRSAINDLQSIAYRKRIDEDVISTLGYRDREKEIFSGLRDIFKADSIRKAVSVARRMDESPDNLILWIDENIPAEYEDIHEIYLAYEHLSRADVFLGRVRRRQYYGLWSYALELMTGGVAISKKHVYRKFTPYHFPSWLREMARSKAGRAMRLRIAKKIGRTMHCSTRKGLDMFSSVVKMLHGRDAAKIAASFEFEKEELEFMLGEDGKKVWEDMQFILKQKQAKLF
ncbi:MAG: replication factor C large subunit [Thermoplasmata archaeon]|nr:replication factor C large subunit [Thermoplasmata archaeon]